MMEATERVMPDYSKFVFVRAIAHPCDEGGFWVEMPGIGVNTDGDNLLEVQANLVEATELMLEDNDEIKDYAISLEIQPDPYDYEAIAKEIYG